MIETHTLPYVEQIARGHLLYDAENPKWMLCDNLEGWDGVGGEREGHEGGDICLIHCDVWQKQTQY